MTKAKPGLAQSRLTVAMLATLFTFGSIPEGYSQSTGPSGGGTGTTQNASTDSDKHSQSTTNYLTNAVVQDINAVRNECAGVEPVYRIDCLRQGLREVARRMPQTGGYREARHAIARAVAQLDRIQGANIDSRAPRKRSRGNARFKLAKTYTAIKKENLNKAMEQARRVVDETQTLLLRSSENSEKRSAHYQKIAAAVGSTKVLLRSA